MNKYQLMAALGLGLLTACSIGGTSPDPSYYTLAPVKGPMMADVTYVIRINRPVLPGYLDRPEIVTQDGDFSVSIDEMSRWAEPLDTMFERVLVQDLQQRMPGARIVTQDDGFMATPRVTIAIALQQFNRMPHQKMQLEAVLNTHDEGTHEQPGVQKFAYDIDASNGTAEDLSTLVGRLADDVAGLMHIEQIKGEKLAPQPPAPRFDGRDE